MRKKIFWRLCVTALLCAVLISGCVLGLLYRKADGDAWAMLEMEAGYIAEAVEAGGIDYLERVGPVGSRLTLIDADGTVLYDERVDAETLDAHSDRPEFAEALAGGVGRASRMSDTFGQRTLYYAVALESGEVLRVATSVSTLWAETVRFVPWLVLISALVVLLTALLARSLARQVLAPLDRIDLKAPLEGDAYEELAPLLRRIAAQNEQIDGQIQALRESRQEFETITENMDEGLIVLGADSEVLSVNHSAKRLLAEPGGAYVGKHVLELSRDLVVDKAVKTALGGQKGEYVLAVGARKYRLSSSPVLQGGDISGAVLLLVDETDKLEAERLRREFSANVSHELKTPLTAIAGYAEIMQKGLVQPEDIGDFAGRIREEADRLVMLVGDIIKLSKLDERETSFEKEAVDLFELAGEAAGALEALAGPRGIRVTVTGAATEVTGIRSILGEVVFNLMDNAIKYNREGGEVLVTVWREGPTAYLQVEDNGPGIPADQQPRVFERFYRVDESHSQEIPGTGLGLSIVKRGVLFHDGEIRLESVPGKGSSFVVSLPVEE